MTSLSVSPSPSYQQKISNANTDAHVFDLWLHNKSETTKNTYITAIKQFVEFTGKGLQNLTLDDLVNYQVVLDSKYQSSHTKKTKIQIVKSLLTYAHKIGYLQVNLGKLISTTPARDARNERILTKEDINKLFQAATTPRELAIVSLLFYCGLRVSELINLRWKDINKVGDRSILTVMGKGNKQRNIPLSSKVVNLLSDLAKESDYIICNARKGKLSRVYVHKILKQLAVKAGITENLSAHWLRHTHATLSLANGCDLALLSKTLGHASIATTGVYLHCAPDKSSGDYL